MPAPKLAVALAAALMAVFSPFLTAVAVAQDQEEKLKSLQQQVDELKKQMDESKQGPAAAAPPTAPGLLTDFKIGGYGSVRFEASDLDNVGNTFTFRRFVLATDATIAQRLRSVIEVEFERFTELEIERGAPVEDDRQGFSNAIEGSNATELSLEQAWLQFELAEWARFRAGMILVPIGRFNINHDDNRWDLPRRSLVDRGVSVLPVPSAWSEVGMGFTGDIPTNRFGKFSYEAYVMNGVALDSSIEIIARGSGELEAEVEVQPQRGTANIDVKKEKAVGARLGWSPALGYEVGASGYYGRYTPDFLPSEPLWVLGADGKATFGPFEIEGQYIYTRYEGIDRVAKGFARAVAEQEFEAGTAPLNTAVEFELAGLADHKHGYWLDLRYRFFPDFLRNTFLARHFENPQFVVTGRWEQAWLKGLVEEVTFTGQTLTSLEKEDRFVNRATVGFAYRPVPLVVFQLAYERTWTNEGKSLATVTNFLPAKANEETANSFMFGVAFGF
jgi:hypothetical protein